MDTVLTEWSVLIEEKIKAACLKMIADGWKIQPGIYLLKHEKKCCPLVALAITEGVFEDKLADPHHGVYMRDLVWALKLGSYETRDFTIGFDNSFMLSSAPIVFPEYHALGERIREWIDSI